MWQRLWVFTFAFSGCFARLVREETARRDLAAGYSRPGVLIPRGLPRPTILAITRAARQALRGESGRAQDAQALFRACRRLPDERPTAEQPKNLISGHARAPKQGIAA